jgi:hypothetical protein
MSVTSEHPLQYYVDRNGEAALAMLRVGTTSSALQNAFGWDNYVTRRFVRDYVRGKQKCEVIAKRFGRDTAYSIANVAIVHTPTVKPVVSISKPVAVTPKPVDAIVNRSDEAALYATHAKRFANREVVTLAPVTEFTYVELNLNGQRGYIPLDISSREARIFNPVDLTTITITREDFDRKSKYVSPRKFKRDRILAGIHKRLAMIDQVNGKAEREVYSDGGKDTQRAIDLLIA